MLEKIEDNPEAYDVGMADLVDQITVTLLEKKEFDLQLNRLNMGQPSKPIPNIAADSSSAKLLNRIWMMGAFHADHVSMIASFSKIKKPDRDQKVKFIKALLSMYSLLSEVIDTNSLGIARCMQSFDAINDQYESLECGSNLLAAKTVSGALVMMGSSKIHPTCLDRSSFHTCPHNLAAKVETGIGNEYVSQFSCSAAHTILLLGHDRLFSFGYNVNLIGSYDVITGQLGMLHTFY